MHRQLAAKTAPASSPRARFALKLHVRKPKILPKIVRLRLFFAHLFGHREQQNASPIDGQDGTGEQSARSQRARFAVKLHVRKPKILPKIAKRSLFFARLCAHS